MFIDRTKSNGEHYYYLRQWANDGSKTNLMNYGRQMPEFSEPDLRLGFSEDQLQSIDTASVDLIIDDPPYGNTQANWDQEPDWPELASELHRVLKDDGQIVVFGRQPTLMPVYNSFTENGFEFRFELIWKKENNPWVSNHQPIPIHENIHVFKKKQAKVGSLTFNTEDIRREGVSVCSKCREKHQLGSYDLTITDERKSQTQGGWQEEYEQHGDESRYPISYIDRDVLEFTSVGGFSDEYKGYAGQKPIPLIRWLLIAMSERGDRILDPHAGSATTHMASIPLCRESVGFEVNPARFKTAQKRVEALIDEVRDLKHCSVTAAEPSASESPADD